MKYALIIGNNKYDDPKLAQLKTPAADSQALAKILDDKTIGSFDEVTPLINQAESYVRRAVSAFLTDKKPDDLVLLYFSGHGVLDDRGRLYLALKDTQLNILKATSIPSSFLTDEMDSCRSKRQILILDCCHSGAFARGTKGEQKAITETTFEGSGFGRVVLTASDSTQYALEGDQVIKQSELSLFTHFLLQGLKTGEADLNNDGHIALDEWYDYTYARVISETPRQVPHKWSYNQRGDLIIARNPFLKKKVVELPYELVQALESSFVGIRESAVSELGKYLHSHDPEMVNLAVSSLKKMQQDDSRRISSLAERLLSGFEQVQLPDKLTSSEPGLKVELVDATVTSEERLPAPKVAARGIGEKTQMARPGVEKSVPFSFSLDIVSNRSFWLKWIGVAALAILFSILFYSYNISVDGAVTSVLIVVFAVVAGFSSLLQWFVMQNRLTLRWVGGNLIAGGLLGWLHGFLYDHNASWADEHLKVLLILWVVGNFILGVILVQNTKEKAQDRAIQHPQEAAATTLETDQQPGIFFISVALALLLFSLLAFSTALSLTSVADIFTIFLGIANIFVGITFILQKNIPRNFGFITLAIFSFLVGIMLEIDHFTANFTQALFSIPGLISLSSGVFFATLPETRKDLRFVMLSGFLISLSILMIAQDLSLIYNIFSILAALFGFAGAILFFLRR